MFIGITYNNDIGLYSVNDVMKCQYYNISLVKQETERSSKCMFYTKFRHKGTFFDLVATKDAQWEGMGDVESVRYEPALLPPCPTIRVLSYSN